MFNNVLVGIDGRAGGHDAVALARQLAAPDARVTLVHVYGAGLMPGGGAAMLLAAERTESERILQAERRRSLPQAETESCADRSVGRGLRDRARRRDADLIVIGASARGRLGRILIGDDTTSTLRGASAPVAVAPRGFADSGGGLARIGVSDDASRESAEAIGLASEIASALGGSVVPLPIDSLDRLPEELEAFSGGVDLLIIGSRRRQIAPLFGARTSNYLARHADCPLLVLPARTAASPADGSGAALVSAR